MIPMDEYEKLREQLSQSNIQLDMTRQELDRLQRELILLRDSSSIVFDKKSANLTAIAVASIEKKQVAKYREELDRLKVELARTYRRVQELEYTQRQSSTALLGSDSRGRRSSLGLDRLYVILKDIKDQLSKKVAISEVDDDQESHRIVDQMIQDSLKSHLSRLENFLNSVAKSSDLKSSNDWISSENNSSIDSDKRFFLLRSQVDDLENTRQTLSDENRRSASKIAELLSENARAHRQLFIAQAQLREMEQPYR